LNFEKRQLPTLYKRNAGCMAKTEYFYA